MANQTQNKRKQDNLAVFQNSTILLLKRFLKLQNHPILFPLECTSPWTTFTNQVRKLPNVKSSLPTQYPVCVLAEGLIIKRLAHHARPQSYSNIELQSSKEVVVPGRPHANSSINPVLSSPPDSAKVQHDFSIVETTHIKANSQDPKLVVPPSIVKIDGSSSSSISSSDFAAADYNQKLVETESLINSASSSSGFEPTNSPYSVSSTVSSKGSINPIPSFFHLGSFSNSKKKLLDTSFLNHYNAKSSRSTSSISTTDHTNNIKEQDNDVSTSKSPLNLTSFSAPESPHKPLHIFSLRKHFSKSLKKYKDSSNSTSQSLQGKM